MLGFWKIIRGEISIRTRPSILCVTLLVNIESVKGLYACIYWKSGDLVRCHRCLTYIQTTEYSATQLVESIKFKLSHAICLRFWIKFHLFHDMSDSFDANRSIKGMCKEYFFAVLSMLLSGCLCVCVGWGPCYTHTKLY